MTNKQTSGQPLNGWAARYHAWRATKVAPAKGFISQPEPRTIGQFAKGRQLCAGNLMFAGEFLQTDDDVLWDLEMPSLAFEEEAHGCTWLDDLAALGEPQARALASKWVIEWITRFPPPASPAWEANLIGRRIIRWINNALFILRGQDAEFSETFYRSLSVQLDFLVRRWQTASDGLPRIEALVGIIYAGLSLEGMRHHVAPATTALAKECAALIDADGAIASRNPEELLEVLTLLTWVKGATEDADSTMSAEVEGAIARIAPTLRCLRHSDGALARFHGGGRGAVGLLDTSLAATETKVEIADQAMGFARLSAGRTSVIVDCAKPPLSPRSHASTLALELTSGRRPLIVNCGAGTSFGDRWARAGRATPSHSTLTLEGLSSAVLPEGQDMMTGGPELVQMERRRTEKGHRLEAAHDAWARVNGLTHIRQMELATSGRSLSGSDTLTTLSDNDKKKFDQALDNTSLQGIAHTVRFHLHPDVEASLDMSGQAVSLVLKSGEIWVFRHDGKTQMTLEPSVYLEKGRLKPRATKQIVLSARAMAYASRIRWSLSKTQETPIAIRDFGNVDLSEQNTTD